MRPLAFFLILVAAVPAWTARGQDEPQPTVITIRPAAAPVPALKYLLLPERHLLIPGNAAIFYHRAIEHLIEVRNRTDLQAQKAGKSPSDLAAIAETQAAWLTQPIAMLPRDEVRKHLEPYEFSLHELELGAIRETCDWEFQRRDEGFRLILDDIQQMRSLGRLIILKARLEIAEGRTESAVHWLQTSFAVTWHINHASNLIQSLIAAAMTHQMAGTLEDLMQAPGSPNLYWALANLPRPFIDLTSAIDGEKYLLEKEFPQLKTLEAGPWSVDQARAFGNDVQKKLGQLTGDWANTPSSASQPTMKDLGEHLTFAVIVARSYPEAKRQLIAQGRPAAMVETMPAIQVVALYSYQLYQEARDDIFKWGGLPYWQGWQGMREAEQHPRAGWDKLKGGLPFAVILPAIRSTFVTPPRVQRTLDVCQCIEALRLYAANHGGTLPPNLEAVTEAPAPLDPITGKPYEYAVDDAKTTATITAPAPREFANVPQFKIRYIIKLAK